MKSSLGAGGEFREGEILQPRRGVSGGAVEASCVVPTRGRGSGGGIGEVCVMSSAMRCEVQYGCQERSREYPPPPVLTFVMCLAAAHSSDNAKYLRLWPLGRMVACRECASGQPHSSGHTREQCFCYRRHFHVLWAVLSHWQTPFSHSPTKPPHGKVTGAH